MEPYPTNPKDELIAKLVKKEVKLSYSSLKNFTTPLNFLEYKLERKQPSPSMVFGSLCDCLLLTPEKFGSEFAIIEKIPESENQVSFSNALIHLGKNQELTEEVIEKEFVNHYKRGKAMDVFEVVKDYVFGIISGKKLVTSDILEEAKSISDNLACQPDIYEIFSQITEVQKKVEWEYNGWTNVGFYDILLENHIIDLKFSRDANPDKFERDILNFDYFLQAGMYFHAARELGISDAPNYSFIVYDKSFNYSIIELDYSYVAYGFRKYQFLVEQLDRCIAEGRFDESYGFFKNVYRVYKPKWAKAFLQEDEEG